EVQPTASTQYYSTNRFVPGLELLLTNVIPNFSVTTPIRVSVYLAAQNIGGATDVIVASVEYIAQSTWYHFGPAWNGAPGGQPFTSVQESGSQLAYAYSANPTTDNAYILTLPNGVGGLAATVTAGPMQVGDWPLANSIDPVSVISPASSVTSTYPGFAGTTWNLLLAAARNGNTE